MGNEIKLVELRTYVTEAIKQLNAFEAWWIEQNKAHPEEFPMTLLEGDWDEQVSFFGRSD